MPSMSAPRIGFDVGMLADRLVAAIDWLAEEPATASLPVGLFGASTGGAAALVAAARRQNACARSSVAAAGRPCRRQAGNVASPTLLVIGSLDAGARLNHEAMAKMRIDNASSSFVERRICSKSLVRSTRGRLAGGWFEQCLQRGRVFPRRVQLVAAGAGW
jgi:dienelactone hydrolase